MATNSCATRVEDWLVAQIESIANIDTEYVEAFTGIEAWDGSDAAIMDELRRKPPKLWIAVRWDNRQFTYGSEMITDAVSTYVIYLVCVNKRPGVARRGDTENQGVNWYAERLYEHFAGDSKRSGADFASEGYTTDEVRIIGQNTVPMFAKDFAMVTMTVEVRESVRV